MEMNVVFAISIYAAQPQKNPMWIRLDGGVKAGVSESDKPQNYGSLFLTPRIRNC
jgi:hypothetical protein